MGVCSLVPAFYFVMLPRVLHLTSSTRTALKSQCPRWYCKYRRRDRLDVHVFRRVRSAPACARLFPAAGQHLPRAAPAPMHVRARRPNGSGRVRGGGVPADGPDADRVAASARDARARGGRRQGGAHFVLASAGCLRPLVPFRLLAHAPAAEHCGRLLHSAQHYGTLSNRISCRRVMFSANAPLLRHRRLITHRLACA